jgi:hypothetical protein
MTCEVSGILRNSADTDILLRPRQGSASPTSAMAFRDVLYRSSSDLAEKFSAKILIPNEMLAGMEITIRKPARAQ